MIATTTKNENDSPPIPSRYLPAFGLFRLYEHHYLARCFNVKCYVGREPLKKDTSSIKLCLEIERESREFIFPFLFVEIRRKKPFYHPELAVSSTDKKVIKFYDFEVELKTLQNQSLFARRYADTVLLNRFKTSNANKWHFDFDTIPELQIIQDSIFISFRLKTIDTLGNEYLIEKPYLKYVRTKYHRFESFL